MLIAMFGINFLFIFTYYIIYYLIKLGILYAGIGIG